MEYSDMIHEQKFPQLLCFPLQITEYLGVFTKILQQTQGNTHILHSIGSLTDWVLLWSLPSNICTISGLVISPFEHDDWLSSRILCYQQTQNIYNDRQQKHSHLIVQSCHRRLRWRTRRRCPIARLRSLCRASIAAEAGPHNSVHAFARQHIDVLVVVLTKRVHVAKRRERAPSSGVAASQGIGAAEGDQSGGVVPTALRGLCACPHGRSVQVGIQIPKIEQINRYISWVKFQELVCTKWVPNEGTQWTYRDSSVDRMMLMMIPSIQAGISGPSIYRHNLPWLMPTQYSYWHQNQNDCIPWLEEWRLWSWVRFFPPGAHCGW